MAIRSILILSCHPYGMCTLGILLYIAMLAVELHFSFMIRQTFRNLSWAKVLYCVFSRFNLISICFNLIRGFSVVSETSTFPICRLYSEFATVVKSTIVISAADHLNSPYLYTLSSQKSCSIRKRDFCLFLITQDHYFKIVCRKKLICCNNFLSSGLHKFVYIGVQVPFTLYLYYSSLPKLSHLNPV